MESAKKFTYFGMLAGSAIGWYLPKIWSTSNSFFTSFSLSIFFGILGTIVGYKLYNFLIKKM